jgi:uncharacterized SAM-binding protein YcdF (DUF218 family)
VSEERIESGKQIRRRGLFVRLLLLSFAAGALAALIFAAGFGLFLLNVPTEEVKLQGDADGIVVLTGGASRIEDAIELLASGHGRRLLISGVHPQTSEREIARLKPEYRKTVLCCVDLDRSAVNTFGNATETRRWAHERGFRSLIVVTSNYHMPRAMAELSHKLPDVTLTPFPVIAERLRANWTSAPALRLLFWEYVKYIVANVRMTLPVSFA